jgi:hypothetical protein
MNGKLAYLIGIIIGDGHLSEPIKRTTHGSGYHWKIVITGPHDYLASLQTLIDQVFGVRGVLVKDKRKENTWQLKLANIALHRFFARVIGLRPGRKLQSRSWTTFDLVREFPLHFLAGLMHSDGYTGKRYVGIIQGSFRFLVHVKEFSKKTLGLNFHGPIVNRKQDGRIVGWIISIYRRRERETLMYDILRLKIGVAKGTNC